MRFERVAIVGTGLIGASVGLALKKARPDVRITGFDMSFENIRSAQRVKAIDRAASLSDAVKDAQLVVLAAPVTAIAGLLADIQPLLAPGTVVMDTGSVKAAILRAAEILPSGVHFVGGHPMAGKTETGPAAADAELFNGAVWCIVPAATASQEAVESIVQLVRSFGARVYFLDPDEHDGLVASISHLPYLMSVALVRHLSRESSWREAAALAAGGFAYASHLADSDPRMFADISQANREKLVARLDLYLDELRDLRDAIERGDESLRQQFEEARAAHQDWLSGRAQATAEEKSEPLPSSRSLLTGSLFGGLNRQGRKSSGG